MRILAKLQEAVAAAGRKSKSKGESDQDKEKAKAEAERRKEIVRALLGALAHHRAPAIAEAAVALMDEYGAPAAWAVVHSGDRKQLERVASAMDGSDADLFPVAAAAAFRLGEAEAFKRLSPLLRVSRLAALFRGRDKKSSQPRIRAVVDCLAENPALLTEQWSSFLVEVLEHERADVAAPVVPLMGKLRERRAVQALIRIVENEKGDLVSAAISALKTLMARMGCIPGFAGAAAHGMLWLG